MDLHEVLSRRAWGEAASSFGAPSIPPGASWPTTAQVDLENPEEPGIERDVHGCAAMTKPKNRFAQMIFRPALAAAGLAGGLGLAAEAEAQGPVLFGQAGTYVGFSWDADRGGDVTWGFEGRLGGDFRAEFQPATDPFLTTAGVVRFGFAGLDPGLWAGGQVGGAMALGSLVGELTLGYQWGEGGGFSLPIGLELDVFVGSTFVRGDPVGGSIAFGGGLVAPPRMMWPMAVPGRALHDETGGQAALPDVELLGERRWDRRAGPELAAELARAWERRARAEWASVPAFLQLEDQLAVAGAPRSLRTRARAAADDELRHAVATARASMRYGGAPLRIGRVTPATRAHARGTDALVRLAVESWVDGCLGEGKASAAAAVEATLAPDAELAAMQRTIAKDERGHAELAWDVMAWAIEAGGDDVRHALAAVRDAGPEATTSGIDDGVDLHAQGLLSEREHAAIGERIRDRALSRFDRLVA